VSHWTGKEIDENLIKRQHQKVVRFTLRGGAIPPAHFFTLAKEGVFCSSSSSQFLPAL
jgi:radical SAM superfamily enzyme